VFNYNVLMPFSRLLQEYRVKN